jgi:N-methylhydantoinase A
MVPALPGALSAFGILVSDVVKDYSRTVLWRVGTHIPSRKLHQQFAQLRLQAEKDFRAEGWKDGARFQKSLDVRYRGQGYELNIPYSPALLPAFHAEHARRYGYSHPGREVELVTLRLRGILPSPHSRLSSDNLRSRRAGRLERSPVVFDGKRVATPLYARSELIAGKRYTGPAIVTEYSATTVVPPEMKFSRDRADNLIMTW